MFVKILPPEVRSKISAGEVVESPSDVVKELVENSLDAQATRIEVELTKGGKKRILVKDNGRGIHPQDLELIFREGATSKISSEEDLFSVKTYGFRGEALYALGSVSRVRVRSRYFSEEEGYEVTCEGGILGPRRLAPSPTGTQVEVRDLFFNQPVRLKFLRREDTETRKIREVITELALANPEVSFTLVSGGRELLSLPPSHEEERVLCILGDSTQKASNSSGQVRVRLYHSPSTGRGKFYIFVNGRPVTDRNLSEILKKLLGYKKNGVLFIELPPWAVDFNVHPKKREVRFLSEGEVRRALEGTFYRTTGKSLTFLSSPRAFPEEEVSILGQINNTVIVAKVGDYIYFFDQHLLSERVNYEKLGEGSEDLSCRISLKAGKPLSEKEMRELIEGWLGASNREVCPHGRPIYFRIHLKEIYDRLGRDFHLY
jgi:DNA mismatch repair protein MutL